MATNEEIDKGLALLKETTEEAGYIENAFRSIAQAVQDAVEVALEGAEDLNDAGKTLANAYGKDIVNSLKKSAKSLEGNLGIQIRINKGKNASKQIEQAISDNIARKAIHEMYINNLSKEQIDLKETLTAEAEKAFELNDRLLKALKKQNSEEQKKISVYNIIGKSLQGMADKIDKTGTLSGILKGNFKEVVTVARLGQLAAIGFATSFAKGLMEVNAQEVKLQKNMALSAEGASKFRAEMAQAALETGTTAVTTRDTLKTMGELQDTLGVASSTIRNDIVGEMANLAKTTDLSAESQANFAMQAQKSGQHARELTFETRRAVLNINNQYGVQLNINKVLDQAGKVTGMIRANLGYNVVEIAGAIAKAKQFGMTLQDLAGISSNLLNFHSSIEAELTAELFTGKQLNLEKARLYALTGDYKGLTEEIKKNAGGELEFARMNVLQKEKLAAALGMSADQMANMVYTQSNLAELAQQATEMGDHELAQTLEKRNNQQKFNDLIEKVQTMLVDKVAPAFSRISDIMSHLLENTGALWILFGAIAGIKLMGLISSVITLASTLAASGVAAATTMSALTYGLGAIAIGAGIVTIIGAMNAGTDKATSKVKSIKSYADLGKEEMVTLDKGSAIFDQGESVVRTENFGKMNDTLAMIHQAIMGQKTTVTAEGWHGTRYR